MYVSKYNLFSLSNVTFMHIFRADFMVLNNQLVLSSMGKNTGKYIQKEEKTGKVTIRMSGKATGNHTINYLPKKIYNTHNSMYKTHT